MTDTDALQPAVAAFIRDLVAAMTDVVSRLPNHETRRLEHDIASEAFDLTAALIDVDWRHTDDELWALITTFGSWLPGQLGMARPDDVRKSSVIAGKARWLERPSTMFQLLADADRRNSTAHSRTYYDRAMHIAFTVASLDENPSTSELRAIDDWRGLLLAAMPELPPTGPPAGGVGPRPGAGPDVRSAGPPPSSSASAAPPVGTPTTVTPSAVAGSTPATAGSVDGAPVPGESPAEPPAARSRSC